MGEFFPGNGRRISIRSSIVKVVTFPCNQKGGLKWGRFFREMEERDSKFVVE